MVWLYRSPIPVGGGGGLFLVQMIFTCLRYAYRGGGEVSTLWVSYRFRICNIYCNSWGSLIRTFGEEILQAKKRFHLEYLQTQSCRACHQANNQMRPHLSDFHPDIDCQWHRDDPFFLSFLPLKSESGFKSLYKHCSVGEFS